MARSLILYETYTRQEVHDIFEPGTAFTPSAGTWGLWGIVPFGNNSGDFVFFVTFGHAQSGHHFDEWVSKQGVINWQSQPRQGLDHYQIQQFIHHDPTKNTIHLFLRTAKTSPYTYLGRLAYFSHDPKRERPVWIQWQILDWNPPATRLHQMGLRLREEEPQAFQSAKPASFEWREAEYPVDQEELQAKIQQHIRAGLPVEALRYRDWYVTLEGQHLSPKWIFHLLTGANYNEFDAPTARDKLAKVGIPSYAVKQVAEEPTYSAENTPPATPPSATKTDAPPAQKDEIQVPAKDVQFEWRGKVYSYNEQNLSNSLRRRAEEGFPEDALKINKWYITAFGHAISLKWIFHRLTKANYEEFTTQQAFDKLSQIKLPILYQASQPDIRRGCVNELKQASLTSDDRHAAHHAFAQAFANKVHPKFGNGKLVFPATSNLREAHYDLDKIGLGVLRQNKNGVLEFSFDCCHLVITPERLQKLRSLLPEIHKGLEYPVYASGSAKTGYRVASDTIFVDQWFDLLEEWGDIHLTGKYVPERWDQYYKKIKQAHPQRQWNELADTLFGTALAEFINAVAPVIQDAFQLDETILEDNIFQLPEFKMGKKKSYIGNTIHRLAALILNLAQFGEIGQEGISHCGLGDGHLLHLVQSGWAIATPYALVATPRLLNFLPLDNQEALNGLLNLTNWDSQGWGDFDRKAFHLPAASRYPQLGFDYIYTPKPNSFFQDRLWRPVWLVNYMPESDWDEWDVSALMQTDPNRREAKLYVHSNLPIQNTYGGTSEVQDAVWKTAFYWLMMQLLILSDPLTGGAYEPKISLYLSDGWRDGSQPRLYLNSDYIGDLGDCLESLFTSFQWVWVNRSGNSSQDQQNILGLLRLLLKVEIAELGKDGRVQFTGTYHSKLFNSQEKPHLYYWNTKESRNQLREAIKEMSH